MPLRPETDEQRQSVARVGLADDVEVRARMEAFKVSGVVLNEAGMDEVTSAAQTRALFFAKAQSSGFTGGFMDWMRGQLE
jgi:hypothetical protein